jgi:hypothetical protein
VGARSKEEFKYGESGIVLPVLAEKGSVLSLAVFVADMSLPMIGESILEFRPEQVVPVRKVQNAGNGRFPEIVGLLIGDSQG